MARRVFSDFDAELLLRLGNRTDISATQRGFFLNDAVKVLVMQFPHPEFESSDEFTVADGDYFLSVDDNAGLAQVWWPTFMQNVDTGRSIDPSTLAKIESQLRVDGEITEYYWYSGDFFFNRNSDGSTTVKLWFKIKPEEWTSGVPPTDSVYDALIPMKAAQLALDTVGDQEKAHIQETAYNNFVSALRVPRSESNRNDRHKGLRVRVK